MNGPPAVGQALPVTTGSAQQVVGRDCQLLGFFSATAGSIVIYDASSTSNLPTPLLTVTTTTVGWYPFPVQLSKGLVMNCGAATTAVVQ